MGGRENPRITCYIGTMSRQARGRPPYDDILTPAEWRVLHAAQHGMSKRVIAQRLQVSQDAVRYHLRNIRDKLGVDSKKDLMSIFRVPKGGRLAAPGDPSTRETYMADNRSSCSIGQIARTVGNLEQSSNWYEVVLEFPLLYSFEGMAFFDCSGTRLMLTTLSPLNENESVLYFSTEDIAARYVSLREKGVEFINAPHMIHRHEDDSEEWMAFFRDPDGRPLALMSKTAP